MEAIDNNSFSIISQQKNDSLLTILVIPFVNSDLRPTLPIKPRTTERLGSL